MIKKTAVSILLQIGALLLSGQSPHSQPDAVETFEIGSVKVTGAPHSDPETILSLAGLQMGDRIKVPGPHITSAQRNLLRQGLFSEVEIWQERTVGDVVFLEIRVTERPRLANHSFRGVKKSKHEDLNAAVGRFLQKGTILTADAKANCQQAIQQYFLEKGYPDAQVMLHEEPGWAMENTVRLVFDISAGKKNTVQHIAISGNTVLSDRQLRKLLPTKPRRKLLSGSKYLPEEWAAGKEAILAKYQSLGHLDARIATDSIWRNAEGRWQMLLHLEEGSRYRFGQISFEGNAKFESDDLAKILDIRTGEVYNPQRLEERLRFSQQADDLTSLYMDDGHLFFNLEQEITAIRGDSIDLRIRIFEGPQASIDAVTIKGNSRTNEQVIRRELRTQPGDKFSRADIIRSQRAIAGLGYFDPEQINIQTPVNAERGTVGIEYTVVEKDNSQVELAGTWGGKDVGIAGTVGLTLNNFSIKNLLDRSTWAPFPTGDGQTLSMRVQSNGKAYQSYNLSFTEPWLGGKRPNSLSFGSFFTRYNQGTTEAPERFSTLGGTVSLGKRLTWPDDNFTSQTAVNFRQHRLDNWTDGLFRTDDGELVSDGRFLDLSIQQTFARSTLDQPFFPTQGSRISLSMAFTPPWSVFSKKENGNEGMGGLLEYQKWRFDADWYTPLAGKLVLRASAKMGFLGSYSSSTGTSPFERFQLGGDPLTNGGNTFTGTDIITLRGYDVADLENNLLNGETAATPIFNKFTVELRYPLVQGNGMNVYGLAFAEAGNSFRDFKSYNPFDLKRSAGVGLRAQLPMIGIIGFDYGLGIDKAGTKSFGGMGKLSIILGFEPD